MGQVLRQFALSWRRARTNLSWWAAVVLMASAAAATITIGLAYRTLVLKPLPGTRATEVVGLGGLAHGGGMTNPVEWWGRAPSIDFISLYRVGDAQLACSGFVKWIRIAEVSSGFFDIFDGVITGGRRLQAEDETGDPGVIVVSQDLFRQLPAAARQTECQIGQHRLSVVGTATSTLKFPSGAQAWIPRADSEVARPVLVEGGPGLAPMRARTGWIAMPKPGTSLARIKVEMLQLLGAANSTLTPKTGVRYGDMVSVAALGAGLTAAVRPGVLVLFISTLVTLVLCLGYVVIHLMASLQAREKDFAIHACLGAPNRHRRHVVAAEASLLAVAIAIGTLTASALLLRVAEDYLAGFRTFVALSPGAMPALFGATAIVVLLVGAASAFAGLLSSRRVSLFGPTGSSLVPISDGRSARVTRRVFLGLASGVATVLLGGTVVAHSALRQLLNTDLGFAPDGIASIRLAIQRSTIDGLQYARRRSEIAELARSAGLTRVSFASGLPVKAEERGFVPVIAADQKIMASISQVDTDFFQVLGVPVSGPGFSDSEDEVILNSSAAQRLLGSQALGQSVRFDGNPRSMRIAGIVPDLRTVDQGTAPVLQVYRRHVEIDGTEMPNGTVQVQLLGACSENCRRALDSLVLSLAPATGVSVLRAETLDEAVYAARGNAVAVANLWSLYGLLAAGASVLAMMSMARQNAHRARREVGLRVALGATPWHTLVRVGRDPLLSGTIGAFLGVVGTSLLMRSFASAVGPIALPSPIDLALAASVLIVVAVVATVASTLKTLVASPSDLLRDNHSE